MMEPTMVCELEAGRPSHQVPRFQRIAAISSAKTMAKPAPELTCKISSTGSSVMTAKATVPEESEHAGEVAEAGPDHGDVRLERVGVDDGGDGVGGVVESVDELEAERDEQRQAEQHVGPRAGDLHRIEIARDVKDDVDHARGKGREKSARADAGWGAP